jgi:periplasmic divalent cation tolerance protein
MWWAAGRDRAHLVPLSRYGQRRDAADILLDEGLIACANLVQGMVSLYMWQGKHRDGETGVLMKTDATCWSAPSPGWRRCILMKRPQFWAGDDATTPATAAWLGGLTR